MTYDHKGRILEIEEYWHEYSDGIKMKRYRWVGVNSADREFIEGDKLLVASEPAAVSTFKRMNLDGSIKAKDEYGRLRDFSYESVIKR